MKILTTGAAGLMLMTTAVVAQEGNPEDGEQAFRQCKACHSIVDDEGNDIQRGGKVGPNLYGVVGRQAGTWDDFRYSDDMIAAGEAGLTWNESDFVVYVQGASEFLQEYLGDDSARGKMMFKLRREQEAHDIWAYLASVSPEPEAEADEGS